MKCEYYKCEMCKKTASSEKVLRRENWIRIQGGTLKGIEVWLEVPRKKDGQAFMHSVGWRDKDYDFCSIDCLVAALKAQESI